VQNVKLINICFGLLTFGVHLLIIEKTEDKRGDLMQGPLSGIKVVEMASFVAAPVTARLMADMGAEVVKVEAPWGDDWRRTGISYVPSRFSQDENPVFAIYNTGKKHVSLNLKAPEGMEAFHRLLSEADVFITNTRPDSLKRLNLSYDALKERYPRLIYAIVLGYGEKGPDAAKPAFDTTAFWTRTGFLRDLAVDSDDYYPINPPSGVGDTTTGYLLLAEISAALYNRERTGKGDCVRSTLYRNGIFCMGTMEIITQKPFGTVYPRKRSISGAPGGSYCCADGEWIFMATGDPVKTGAAIHRIIGRPDLTDSPRYNGAERKKNFSEYYGIIRDAFLTKTSDEWIRSAEAEDIPIVRMNHFSDVSQDPQAWANGYVEHVVFPNGNTDVMPSSPIEMDSANTPPTVPPPAVGTHTSEVLRSLGYTESQIRQMLESGAAVDSKEESR